MAEQTHEDVQCRQVQARRRGGDTVWTSRLLRSQQRGCEPGTQGGREELSPRPLRLLGCRRRSRDLRRHEQHEREAEPRRGRSAPAKSELPHHLRGGGLRRPRGARDQFEKQGTAQPGFQRPVFGERDEGLAGSGQVVRAILRDHRGRLVVLHQAVQHVQQGLGEQDLWQRREELDAIPYGHPHRHAADLVGPDREGPGGQEPGRGAD
mmetsp:Transcript_40329/g.115881  ORF Transcript_40329/g.115881 Transcript_40329/m.115881 type:complete len:208 (-) Transcript_40329:104-727(-)